MATQPSQTPAKTSKSSVLLSYLNYISPCQSTSNDHGLSASLAASSDIHVPTELQQAHDFQSTAAQADTSRTVNSIDYCKGVHLQLLQFHEKDESFIKLEGCLNGLGASKSWIFNYGWRAQQKGVLPEVYY
jgi:hypothetical protein